MLTDMRIDPVEFIYVVGLFSTLCLSGPVVQRQNGPSSEESEAQRRYDFCKQERTFKEAVFVQKSKHTEQSKLRS